VHRIIPVVLIAASPLAVAAPSCGADLHGAQTLESADYIVAYRAQPAKIEVGKHFALDMVTCSKGHAPAPARIAVDAFMPDHGHGMNYKAVVTARGDPRAARRAVDTHFRAEGLMFHMPGRWDLYFDVQGAGGTERLTRSITLE
jgi:hypothetical protein